MYGKIMEKSILVDDFVVIMNDNYFIKKNQSEDQNRIKELEKKIEQIELEKLKLEKDNLEKENKNLKEELTKEKQAHFDLKRRYADVIKMMCEIFKIKQAIHHDENLEQIRIKVTQLVYHELRLHSAIPFTSIMGTLRVHTRAENDKQTEPSNRIL
jgi:hypothetical protein